MIGTSTPKTTWLTRKVTSNLKLMERLAKKAADQKTQRDEATTTTPKPKQNKKPSEQ